MSRIRFGWLPYVIFANAPRPQEFWGESDLADLSMSAAN